VNSLAVKPSNRSDFSFKFQPPDRQSWPRIARQPKRFSAVRPIAMAVTKLTVNSAKIVISISTKPGHYLSSQEVMIKSTDLPDASSPISEK
jgi:hypothetical protein